MADLKNKDGPDEPVKLKRELGLFSAINLILAVMIGSGIFVSPASALKYSGSVGLCIIVWCVCGVVSLLGALVYAELGTLVPRSGGEYAYFRHSFGPLHKFWGNLPSFLYSWISILIIRPAEVAVITLTFSKYLCQPILNVFCLEDATSTEQVTKSVALVGLGIITFINILSVKVYVKVQNVFGFFKVLACLIVIAGGIYELSIGNTKNLYQGFEGTTTSPKDIALVFYSGLWAYDGWSAVTGVTEEIKRPEVNILRSIIIAVPLVTSLYVFMNIAYMTVLNIDEMVSSDAVAVTFGERVLGSFSYVIPVGVALSTFGCALTLQFGVTRLCYVSGQDGLMLESLSYVHYKRLTPAPAVVLQGIASTILILAGEVTQLIEFASFLLWLFYGLAMVSLIVLRRTMKDAHRPFKVPIVIPIFILLVSLYLSAVPIIMEPTPKYLIALGFMFLGVIVYYWFVYKGKRPDTIMGKSSFDRFTYFLQVLFVVVPSEHSEELYDT
ncbi:hypothetical protein NQ318_010857 [Aromia moschata]|uniref:b(0,+)-type amino acid transporter 1 n=1 Tax=Aromia moschata TaxID=1265417 RepID=A0AAV8YHH5_9CUCU|nr:hypothetical protein NQ318_010857 [Aromia moschata]